MTKIKHEWDSPPAPGTKVMRLRPTSRPGMEMGQVYTVKRATRSLLYVEGSDYSYAVNFFEPVKVEEYSIF